MIVFREERLFTFDVMNSLSKSNGGRERRPNFVFCMVVSVLFVSGWVVMAWSKILFRVR